MLQQRIRQPANRAEIDVGARLQVLRKYTDPTFADAAAEAKCAACAYGASCAAFGACAGGDACRNGTTDGDGLGFGDADYVIAVVVGGGVEVCVGPDGVAEGLDDCFGRFVIPGRPRAETGAAAIDTESGGSGIEEEGEGADAEYGLGVVHFEGV